MPILNDFTYHRPTDLPMALELLAEEGSRPLAGGTDLNCWLREGMVQPISLIDLKRIPELGQLSFENGLLKIGARVTFTELMECLPVQERFPVLAEMAEQVGSVGIRNRATVVGNICSAVACCDSGPLLLTYEALVVVLDASGESRIPITQWFLGNRRTALQPGQIVTGLEIPDPGPHGAAYVKLGRYLGQDLAQAGVAVLALPEDQYRVAFGSVAATPFRGTRTESVLNGQKIDINLIQKAKQMASEEVSPISDVRASKEYRIHMIQIMFERGLKAAISRLEGRGPAHGTVLL